MIGIIGIKILLVFHYLKKLLLFQLLKSGNHSLRGEHIDYHIVYKEVEIRLGVIFIRLQKIGV